MESIFNILAGFTSVSAGQPFSEGTERVNSSYIQNLMRLPVKISRGACQ